MNTEIMIKKMHHDDNKLNYFENATMYNAVICISYMPWMFVFNLINTVLMKRGILVGA